MYRFLVFDKHDRVFIDREIPVASSLGAAKILVGQLLASGMLDLPRKAARYKIIEVPDDN